MPGRDSSIKWYRKGLHDANYGKRCSASSIFFPHSHPACLRRKIDNGGVFAPPSTLPIHMDCGPMPSDGLHPRVWPPLSGSVLPRLLFTLQDGEGWSFTFGPGRRCTFNAQQGGKLGLDIMAYMAKYDLDPYGPTPHPWMVECGLGQEDMLRGIRHEVEAIRKQNSSLRRSMH